MGFGAIGASANVELTMADEQKQHQHHQPRPPSQQQQQQQRPPRRSEINLALFLFQRSYNGQHDELRDIVSTKIKQVIFLIKARLHEEFFLLG